MKAWLKGGLYGSIILFLGIIIESILGIIYLGKNPPISISIFYFLDGFFADLFNFPYGLNSGLIPIMSIIIFFIIGALIGFIVGKIKSTKK